MVGSVPSSRYECVIRDNRESETRARVKITQARKRLHAWGDFHARSRFPQRSTIPEEKWETTRRLVCYVSFLAIVCHPFLTKEPVSRPLRLCMRNNK